MRNPNFTDIRALCIGDVMLDRFIQGSVYRISPESPVPVLKMEKSEIVPGGAANVSRNISALGGHCTLISVIGADPAGEELAELLRVCGRIEPIMLIEAARPTIEKIRYVAQGQHLLRADREEPGYISSEVGEEIVTAVRDRIHDHDVLVLSDYAKGLLTDHVIKETIRAAHEAGVPVVVDPKSADLERYAGATVVTPNAKEATLVTGIDIIDSAAAERAARMAIKKGDISALLLTRSEQGMTLVEQNGNVVHLPANTREVFDVVGAGDTVVATLALCLGGGMTIEASARISNAAAGVVVAKPGTATVTISELIDELHRLSRPEATTSNSKIVTTEGAVRLREQWSKDGLTVGFTNGCFDILHVGHMEILEFARRECDRLIVGVNKDASVSRLKGPTRPINMEEDRAKLLSAFGCVDAVVLFEEDTPMALIEAIRPDVLVKGADYSITQVVGHDVVQRHGGKVILFELIPERSTTKIIDRAGAREEQIK